MLGVTWDKVVGGVGGWEGSLPNRKKSIKHDERYLLIPWQTWLELSRSIELLDASIVPTRIVLLNCIFHLNTVNCIICALELEWAFPEKIQMEGLNSYLTSLKKFLEILDLLLCPWKNKVHPWKFCKIVLHSLEIPRAKTKTNGNSLWLFLDYSRKFYIFFIEPLEFSHTTFSIPLEIPCPQPPASVWIFFGIAQCPLNLTIYPVFWNQVTAKISQKIKWFDTYCPFILKIFINLHQRLKQDNLSFFHYFFANSNQKLIQSDPHCFKDS